MRIAYLLSPGTMVSGRSNGIRQQALAWKNELERRGHEVEFLESAGDYDWTAFTVVHVFQGGDWLQNIIPSLRRRVKKLVLSPIIDSDQPPALYRMAAGLECRWLRLRTENVITRRAAQLADAVFVRSKHEEALVRVGLGVPVGKIRLVKIGFTIRTDIAYGGGARLPVCLHVSSFTQERKNAARLIDACRLTGTELWIAGSSGSADAFAAMQKRACGLPIKFLGFQSDAELAGLMRKARVFALPSLCEGVGLAALEAAALGCEVVVTSRGGPPDYFSSFAHYVNPRSVSSIAKALKDAMSVQRQPDFGGYIRTECSIEASVDVLENNYKELAQCN